MPFSAKPLLQRPLASDPNYPLGSSARPPGGGEDGYARRSAGKKSSVPPGASTGAQGIEREAIRQRRGRAVASPKKGSRLGRLAPILVAAVLLCGVVFLVFFGDGGRLAWGPCAPGGEYAAEGASGEAKKLLGTRNFEASPKAVGDLKAGVVDERLVTVLQAAARENRICVDAFKEGHSFLPGIPDGPLIPDGYGEAGGLPNTHYYGRAADIQRVNGKPIQGNGTDPEVLAVGEAIVGIPPQERPDQIIGPESWVVALDRSSEEGWILDEDQLKLHEDHLHVGYMRTAGTWNAQ